MKLRALALVSLATLTLPFMAHARIGETAEEIGSRYGAPVSVNENRSVILYRTQTHFVRVEYSGKLADLIAYRKTKAAAMSASEIETLLSRHGNTQTWQEIKGKPGHRAWKTMDGKNFARYSSVNGILLFMNKDKHESVSRPILTSHAASIANRS